MAGGAAGSGVKKRKSRIKHLKKLCNSAKLDNRYRAALNNGCGAGHGDSAEMGAGLVPGYGSGLGAGVWFRAGCRADVRFSKF